MKSLPKTWSSMTDEERAEWLYQASYNTPREEWVELAKRAFFYDAIVQEKGELVFKLKLGLLSIPVAEMDTYRHNRQEFLKGALKLITGLLEEKLNDYFNEY